MTTDRNAEDAALTEAQILKKYRAFVLREAKRLVSPMVGIDELVQEGEIALVRSWRQWRPDGGANVLTWIRRPVQHALWEYVRKARGRGLTPHAKQVRGSRERVYYAVSLDAPLRAEEAHRAGFSVLEGRTRHDTIGAFEEPPDHFARARLVAAFSDLSERERAVLRWRFVDGAQRPEIGRRLGIGKERVRQIEAAALEKLKKRLQSRGTDVH